MTKNASQIWIFLVQHNDLGQNPKVAVFTLLSQLVKIVDTYHPFMTTSFLEINILIYIPKPTCGKISSNSATTLNVLYSTET